MEVRKRIELPDPAVAVTLLLTLFAATDRFAESEILAQWYVMIIGAVICGGIALCICSCLSVDRIGAALALFIGYLLLRNGLRGWLDPKALLLTSFFVFYLVFRSSAVDRGFIRRTILTACLSLAGYGLLQWTGVIHVHAAVKGNFDNPAGLAACLAAGYPYFFQKYRGRFRYIRYAGVVLCPAAILVSGSRAGIVALLAAALLFFVIRHKKHILIHLKWYLPGMALALTTAACGLYFLKPDSASGRIPIWRNTLKMIGEHMPFGAGPNSFLAEYMSCQGAYFAEHPESRYAMLADNVAHPFNEYLLLGAEYGLFAWALFGLVAYCILKAPLKKTIPLLSLTSIALFACFSYPLRYSFVIVLVAFGLSAMHSKPIVRFTLKPILKISLSILLLIELGAAWKDILFEARWKQQINAVMLGKKASALESYNQLYLTRNHNPYFLYNYGMMLNDTGNYSLSYDILKECSQYLNDYDVQIGMGDICFRLKAYGKAEDHYVTASRMIPSRFAPLSRLLECYMEMQEEENAMQIAEEILRKQTKIPSTEIDEIRTKAFDYIKSR